MNKTKKHTGNLNISETQVSVDTNINYVGIEITFIGRMAIESVLPSYYLVQKGNNKIVILKFLNNDEIHNDLFNYFGQCLISRATIVDKDNVKHNLYINKLALELWNTLYDVDVTAGNDWDSLTRNWEDIDFEGRNDDVKKLTIIKDYDKETKSISITRQYSKKPVNIAKKDRNSARLTDLYTKGQEYKKVSNNTDYSGKYYIDLTTKQIYTDSGELLTTIKDIKKIIKGISHGTKLSSSNY